MEGPGSFHRDKRGAVSRVREPESGPGRSIGWRGVACCAGKELGIVAPTIAVVRRSAFVATFAVIAAAIPGSFTRAEVVNPTGVAVIIGNANYEHRDVPPVDFAHRDAEAFRRYVIEVLGYDPANVIDLRDASRRKLHDVFGTRSNPEGLLWSYLDPVGGSDVVVFYSGHGVPGTDDGRGYLLPVDADPNAAADDGYPIDLLYRNVGGLAEARSVRVYLDACFSGGSHAGQSLIRNASPVYVAATLPVEVAGKVTALAAASGEQVASWDEAAGHGLFTHHLLDALYGSGDADGDGRVTASEVKAHLDRHMTRAARRQHRRIQQASLVGEADAVLASAGDGGAFPARPGLDEGGSAGPGSAAGEAEPPPSAPSASAAASVEAGLGLTYAQRLLVQHGLASLGFETGVPDGVFGSRTRAGIAGYQRQKGLAETGYLTGELRDALVVLGEAGRAEGARRRLAEERPAADDAAAVRSRAPGKTFRDCALCPEMVVVPAGRFRMGSPDDEEGRFGDEGPVHEVTITAPLAVGKYEVTRGEFGAFVAAIGHSTGDTCHTYEDGSWSKRQGRSWQKPGYAQADRHPVVCVSWEDAQAYVRWLSAVTDERYRLLSESEWEYAARSGTTTSRYWGDDPAQGCGYANGADQTALEQYPGWVVAPCRDGHVHTAAVGSFRANAFSLHDMLGNVWEWVKDCSNDSYVGAPSDGSAWPRGDCTRHVGRGGSWDDSPRGLRSAIRLRNPPGGQSDYLGFRVARTLAP